MTEIENEVLPSEQENDVNKFLSSLTLSIGKQFLSNMKKRKKRKEGELICPNTSNYKDILLGYNYNIKHLKKFCKTYSLKVGGNKHVLLSRIFTHLHLSYYVTKIQKVFRRNLVQKYVKCHGPAYRNKELCTNNTDFVTMEELKEISFHNFFSYKDIDEHVYGFSVFSLYNLIFIQEKSVYVKNPYNRNIIPEYAVKDFLKLLHYATLLKIKLNLLSEDDNVIPFEKSVELYGLEIFQKINGFGHQSDIRWFLSLSKRKLINFVYELFEIWEYRANLSPEVKVNICPNGSPFRNVYICEFQEEPNIWNIRKRVLDIINLFITTGVDEDSKSLGAYYILGALTIVSHHAASTMPWLFDAMF